MTKTCCVCSATYENNWPHSKFCSKECSRTKTYNTYKNEYAGKGLSTAKVGTISELLVCSDLITKGYDVFRAVSSSCSCDVAILKDGKLTRIEVRTGYRNNAGKKWTNMPKDKTRFDVLAICFGDHIDYTPSL